MAMATQLNIYCGMLSIIWGSKSEIARSA